MSISPKVYIAMPTLRGTIPPVAESLDNNRMSLLVKGYHVAVSYKWGDGCISRARNQQIAEFLESDADYYVQWSDDISVEQNDALLTLVQSGKDFTGGLYAKSCMVADEKQAWTSQPESPVRMDGPYLAMTRLSGGFWCLTKEAIDSVPKPLFLEELGPNGTHITEDYTFCDSWHGCGGDIWANTDLTLSHWGYYPYRLPIWKRP